MSYFGFRAWNTSLGIPALDVHVENPRISQDPIWEVDKGLLKNQISEAIKYINLVQIPTSDLPIQEKVRQVMFVIQSSLIHTLYAPNMTKAL